MARSKFWDDLKTAKISVRISIFLIVTFFILFFLPGNFVIALALDSQTVFSLTGFYQLFTYWIMQSSLPNLILISLSIILAGIIIEKALLKKDVLIMSSAAIILGGAVYTLLNDAESVLLGASTLSWGFGGSAMAIVFKTWKHAPRLAKTIVFIITIGYVLLFYDLLFLTSSQALTSANITSGLVGIVYGSLKMQSNSIWNKKNEPVIVSDI